MNTTQDIPVITLDGPSGTGKGTIAGLLAERLGWHILDSGALYRVLAIGTEDEGISREDAGKICEFANKMAIEFSTRFPGSIVLNGHEISARVRLEETGEKASLIAAVPEIRKALLDRQRHFQRLPGLVADGRDMGTVVFPGAALKIFLTASAEERAQRRYKQLINKEVSVNLRALLQDIEARDERDARRQVSPLVPAQDAVVIDTTAMSIEEVLADVLQKAKEKHLL